MTMPLLVWFSAGCFILFLFAIRKFIVKDEPNGIPMPRHKSSILGHASSLRDTRKVLQVFMKWFGEIGDVFQIRLFHKRVVVSANPEDCFQMLSNTKLFARPEAQTRIFELLQSDNLQTMDRLQHKLDRQEIRVGLNDHRVAKFSNIVNRSCRSLVDNLTKMSEREGKPINITPKLADTTSRILFEAVLDTETIQEFREYFANVSKGLLSALYWEIIMYPLGRFTSVFGGRTKLFKYHKAVQDISNNILDNYSHREYNNNSMSLLHIIANTHGCRQDRGKCASLVSAFAIAGFESSSEAITWALYELVRRPDVLEKLHGELDDVLINETTPTFTMMKRLPYLQACWKETLRLHPASGFILRVASKDSVLPGSKTRLKKGTQVGVLIAGAHRNPKYFEKPDEFNPERWLSGVEISEKAQLAFSAGVEGCPGKGLANFEGPAILASLVKSFEMKMACEEDDVQQISDWTDRARTRGPGKPEGDLSWSIPLILKPKIRL